MPPPPPPRSTLAPPLLPPPGGIWGWPGPPHSLALLEHASAPTAVVSQLPAPSQPMLTVRSRELSQRPRHVFNVSTLLVQFCCGKAGLPKLLTSLTAIHSTPGNAGGSPRHTVQQQGPTQGNEPGRYQ